MRDFQIIERYDSFDGIIYYYGIKTHLKKESPMKFPLVFNYHLFMKSISKQLDIQLLL